MKSVLLGVAVAIVIGMVYSIPRRKNDAKAIDEDIKELQEHFKSLDRLSA